jgi:hypothetical protein
MGIFALELNPKLLRPIDKIEDLSIIMISDFLISDRKVMNKFDRILTQMQDNLFPVAFILMG